MWHYEFEDLIVLKNNKGIDDARARKVDYCFQVNGYMYQRLLKNQDISFFSPNDVKGLYDAFCADQDEFARLYEKYESDKSIRRKVISAREAFSMLITERYETGRIYVQHIDHSNTHSAFNPKKAPIEQSNLCLAGDSTVTLLINDKYIESTMQELNDVYFEQYDEIKVKSFDLETNLIVYNTVLKSALMNTNAKVMKLTTSSGHLIHCTPYHKIYTKGVGYVIANDITTEDEVMLENGEFTKIVDINTECDNIAVYDITVEDTHCFFANNVLVHNCMEITLPSRPFVDVNHNEDGLISLCTLAAINWGNFNTPQEMELACELAVRALDAVLDYQDYPVTHAKRATDLYRPLGVGIVNFAYFLAKRGLKYDESALSTVNEWSEAWSYYLMKASVQLAKEKGRCEGFEDLKYAEGILPIDTYKDSVNELVPHTPKMPWDELREEIREHGIRNATLTALMPSESSSIISNSTSGIEPVRSLVTKKVSKDGVLSQVVPEIGKLKNKYDLLWEQTSPLGYIKVMSVLQKYIDQAISANTSYNPQHFPDQKVPMSVLLKDVMTAYKFGLKTLYYNNTMDNAKEVDVEKMIEANDAPKAEDDNPVLKFLKQGTASTSSSEPRQSSYDFTARDGDNDCKDGCSI